MIFLIGLTMLGATGFGVFVLVRGIWTAFAGLKPEVAVAIVAAVTTILASVLAIVLGRYFERRREVEAHFRESKLKLYEEFVDRFFHLFQNEQQHDSDKLTEFLKEWQRRIILRGSPRVIKAYFDWKNHLASREPDADSIFLMDAFFRELRADVGQSSSGLSRGAFSNLILRHAPLFLSMAKKNPKLKLAELAEIEKRLYGEKT